MEDRKKEELYCTLAKSKEEVNINQAYLAYKQAAFYAKMEDKKNYVEKLEQLQSQIGFEVNPVSIIILSFQDLKTTRQCIESIQTNEDMSSLELIVIDNASTDGSAEWLRAQEGIKVLLNDKNLGFPAACNQGIACSKRNNDILLLNNDTRVPPDAIFWLRMGLYETADTGASGSISNSAPNYQNIEELDVKDTQYLEYGRKFNVFMERPYELKSWLVGFCLLIKRKVLERTGYLDERFTPGNFEDNDLETRIAHLGYKQRLCLNSFVFHYGSKSFSRNADKFMELYQSNTKKYLEKWGLHPYLHTYIRNELLSFMPKENGAYRILEVGCGCGATLARLRRMYPDAQILGIDKEEKRSRIASQIEPTICIDIMDASVEEIGTFDYILLGGIFEHVMDLEGLLCHIKKFLKPNGMMISSVYNFMNPHILKKIADGDFVYEEEGILAHDHVRFYTIQTLLPIFQKAGHEVINLSFQKNKLTPEEIDFFEEISRMHPSVDQNQYLAYQYILVSKCKSQ